MAQRLFSVQEIVGKLETKDKATKTVFYENARSNGVVWYIPPGEELPAHFHPETDDVWIVLAGEGNTTWVTGDPSFGAGHGGRGG